ncbi:hypothetical protein HYS48_01405 [Candidatus Woesearchaeota archaeon]|nr:hypothetical protein [Candidatus Woesearchaeota archaeon]
MKWWRKVLRLAALLIPLLSFVLSWNILITSVGILVLAMAAIELYRFSHPLFNTQLFLQCRSLFKRQERGRISGIFWYLASSFFILFFFEQDIAIPALFFTTLGDGMANIIGEKFGRKKIFHRSLEGSLACLFFCLVAGLILKNFLNITPLQILLGSITATVVELFSIGMDDNLTMGILSAWVMSVV